MSTCTVIKRVRDAEHLKRNDLFDDLSQFDSDVLQLCMDYENLESRCKRLVEELRQSLGGCLVK